MLKTNAASSLRAGIAAFACILCLGHVVMISWLWPWVMSGKTNARVDLGPPSA